MNTTERRRRREKLLAVDFWLQLLAVSLSALVVKWTNPDSVAVLVDYRHGPQAARRRVCVFWSADRRAVRFVGAELLGNDGKRGVGHSWLSVSSRFRGRIRISFQAGAILFCGGVYARRSVFFPHRRAKSTHAAGSRLLQRFDILGCERGAQAARPIGDSGGGDALDPAAFLSTHVAYHHNAAGCCARACGLYGAVRISSVLRKETRLGN